MLTATGNETRNSAAKANGTWSFPVAVSFGKLSATVDAVYYNSLLFGRLSDASRCDVTCK